MPSPVRGEGGSNPAAIYLHPRAYYAIPPLTPSTLIAQLFSSVDTTDNQASVTSQTRVYIDRTYC